MARQELTDQRGRESRHFTARKVKSLLVVLRLSIVEKWSQANVVGVIRTAKWIFCTAYGVKLARLCTLKKVQLLFKMYLEQMLKLVEDTLHDFLGRMKQMFTIGKKKGGVVTR